MSSSTVSLPTIQRERINQANLFYTTAENGTWTRLPPTPYSDEWNIYNVDILFNIQLAQKFRGGAGTCTLRLSPSQYNNVKISMDEESRKGFPDILLEIDILETPFCYFSRSKPGNDDPHTLADFPLYDWPRRSKPSSFGCLKVNSDIWHGQTSFGRGLRQ